MSYQPKTGEKCSCRRGMQRDNCPSCEGTGMRIDFRAIHAAREKRARLERVNAQMLEALRDVALYLDDLDNQGVVDAVLAAIQAAEGEK